MSRTTKCGYWKATGSDKRISSSSCNGIVGIRKTLVFYQGKSPNGCRTNWILHEYRLVNVETSSSNSTQVTIWFRSLYIYFFKFPFVSCNDIYLVNIFSISRIMEMKLEIGFCVDYRRGKEI